MGETDVEDSKNNEFNLECSGKIRRQKRGPILSRNDINEKN